MTNRSDIDALDTPPRAEDLAWAPDPRASRRYARLLRKHQLGWLGMALVGTILLTSLFGPIFVGHDPNASNLVAQLAPIGAEVEGTTHWLGTDQLGRDIFARVLEGGRASMSVVLLALLLGAGLGTVLGMISGFRGGRVDNVIMRVVDAFLSLPTLVLAMFVAATLGTGFTNTAITLGIATWPTYARLIRAEVLMIRQEEYIQAAVAVGSGERRILLRHVTPNVLSALLVVASLELGSMVLIESSLSYLGFGMQPPDASWGSMIRQGQAYVQSAWWLSAVPGAFIALTVLGLNLVGDWLRDLFDPHMT